MSTTTILLIRHGNSTAGKSIPGRLPGIDLSPEGKQQAQKLASQLKSLPLAAVYSSPLQRTALTARAIAAEHSLEVHEDEGLIEVDFGDWTGRTFDELESIPLWKRFHEFRTGIRIPGGESLAEVQVRMVRTLESIRSAHPDQMVAVVSHGDPVRSVVAFYSGVALDMALRIDIDTCGLSAIALADWGPRILCINAPGEFARLALFQ